MGDSPTTPGAAPQGAALHTCSTTAAEDGQGAERRPGGREACGLRRQRPATAGGRDTAGSREDGQEAEARQEAARQVQAACVQHGGFVAGAQQFDGLAFGISAAEASSMDPQQRMLLEAGYVALHASSFDKATLNGSGTGVALGIYATEFAQILAQGPLGRSVYATANTLSIASGRVSFALGLHGPCASFETACSASLVAGHSAARALQHDECDTHLAAGVNLMLLQASSTPD